MDGGSAGVAGAFTCLTGDHFPGKRAGGECMGFISGARDKTHTFSSSSKRHGAMKSLRYNAHL
jgi:hypothetical protein